MFKNFGITLQSLHQNIQILRKRDVIYLAKSNYHMLNIDSNYISLSTEFMFTFLNYIPSVNHIWLIVSPIERFKIITVFLLVCPSDIELVYHNSGFLVRKCTVQAILRVTLSLRLILPICVNKLWSFYFDRGFSTHLLI
jgi:hypothetical protein